MMEHYHYLKSKGRCTNCGSKPPVSGSNRCEECRLRINKANQGQRLEHIQNGLCGRCYRSKAKIGGHMCQECLDKMKLYNQGRTQDIKKETFNAYGGAKCACCGETELHMLCLDHINGDGGDHRRELKKRGIGYGGGYKFYRYLKSLGFPDKGRYRVLCFNCNTYIGLMGEPCYHKRS